MTAKLPPQIGGYRRRPLFLEPDPEDDYRDRVPYFGEEERVGLYGLSPLREEQKGEGRKGKRGVESPHA